MRSLFLVLAFSPAAFAGDINSCSPEEMNLIASHRHPSGGVNDRLGAGANTPWTKALHNADENTERFVSEHAAPVTEAPRAAEQDKLQADLARLQGFVASEAGPKPALDPNDVYEKSIAAAEASRKQSQDFAAKTYRDLDEAYARSVAGADSSLKESRDFAAKTYAELDAASAKPGIDAAEAGTLKARRAAAATAELEAKGAYERAVQNAESTRQTLRAALARSQVEAEGAYQRAVQSAENSRKILQRAEIGKEVKAINEKAAADAAADAAATAERRAEIAREVKAINAKAAADAAAAAKENGDRRAEIARVVEAVNAKADADAAAKTWGDTKPATVDAAYLARQNGSDFALLADRFDPPSEMQRKMVLDALSPQNGRAPAKEVYLVVQHGKGQSFEERRKMAELAFGGNPRVKILDASSYGNVSYAQLLDKVAAGNGKGTVTSLTSDAAFSDASLGRLKSNNVRFVVSSRPENKEMTNDVVKAALKERLDKNPSLFRQVEDNGPSAADLRRALETHASNESRDALPASVRDYLNKRDRNLPVSADLEAKAERETKAAIAQADADAAAYKAGKPLPPLTPLQKRELDLDYTKNISHALESKFDRLFPTTGFKDKAALVSAIEESGPDARKALKMLQDENVDFLIRADEFNRDEIGRTGLKNVHETGVNSRVGVASDRYLKLRDQDEANRMGISTEAYRTYDDAWKPKYGYLSPKEGQSMVPDPAAGVAYGNDTFALKKSSVRDRTFWTAGEPFEVDPKTLSKHEPRSWQEADVPWKDREVMVPLLKLDDPKNQFKLGKPALPEGSPLRQFQGGAKNSYHVGLKVWGPITLDDVESFSFRTDPPNGDFLLRLHEKGVKVYDLRSGTPVAWSTAEHLGRENEALGFGVRATKPFATVSGAPIYSKRALANLDETKPAVAAAVRYRDAADDSLGESLRNYFAYHLSESRIKYAESQFGSLAGPVTGRDEASRRLDYLRQYQGILGRQAARARADGKPSLAASYEAARDAVGLQLVGALRDRSVARANRGNIARVADRLDALKGLTDEAAYLPYKEALGGRTLEETLSDPGARELFGTLRARDAAREAAAATEARASLEKVVARKIAPGSSPVQTKRMTDDLIDLSSAITKDRADADPYGTVRAALSARGWDDGQIRNALGSSLWTPWKEIDGGKNALNTPETYGLLLQGSLAKADPAVTREAREIVGRVPDRALIGNFPEDIVAKVNDERAKAMALASSLTDRAAHLPGEKNVEEASRVAQRAQLVTDARAAEVDADKGIIGDLRHSTPAQAELTDLAAASVKDFQREADNATLAKIAPSLDGLSAKDVAAPEKRAELYDKLTDAVSALPPEKKAALFDAVADSAARKGDDFGKGLSAATKPAEEKLAQAFTKADRLADALGSRDGIAAHAVYRDAKLEEHHQALADALHVSGDRVRGKEEATRDMKAQAKAAEAERVTAVKAADRSPASVTTAPQMELLAYEKFSKLEQNDRVVLTQALTNIATKDMDRAQRNLQHLEALQASSSDTFDLYRVALGAAANAFATGGKDWETAWEEGVKFMLKDSGVPESQFMDKAHPTYFKKTARCLGIS